MAYGAAACVAYDEMPDLRSLVRRFGLESSDPELD
jgi:hypothetical protein